ncbi:MAG: hypothetical protein HYZ43_01485 [Flavobacteriia bacterium]|nr:hypothetical protein [Flavobacteriia bacterium]
MDISLFMRSLTLVSPIVLLTGVIIGTINIKKNPEIGQLIFGYFIAGLLLEITSRYWGQVNAAKNNLIFLSISGVVDFLFFTVLYFRFFFGRKRTWLLFLSFPTFILLFYMMYHKAALIPSAFDAYDKVICDGIIVFYALLSSYDLINGKEEVRTDVMRVNAVVLLFFSLDLLFSLTTNFLINAGTHFVIYFWILRFVLLTTLYTTLAYTLWQIGKNRKH